MSVDTYQALLSASMGIVVATIALLIFGRGLSAKGWLVVLGVAAFAGIQIELFLWPMNDAYDPRRLLAAGLGGAFGGAIGGAVGAGFDLLRGGKKFALALPLAGLGILASEVTDFGGTRVGKSMIDAILPPLERPGARDMTFAEFKAELLEDDEALSAGLGEAYAQNPETMDVYFRWLQREVADAEARGLRGSQIEQDIMQKSAVMSDDMLLRADEQTVNAVLDIRLETLRDLAAINPAYCMGSIDDMAMSNPDVQKLVTPVLPQLLGLLLPFEESPKRPLLTAGEFERISQNILSELYGRHGDAIFVFTGEIPVTESTKPDYCAVENDFLAAIAQLPDGPTGLREEYYQTLTATLLGQQ